MNNPSAVGCGHMDQLGQQAKLADLRLIGTPGSFTAWGGEFVRQIAEAANCVTQVRMMGDAPLRVREADGPFGPTRILLVHGPDFEHPDIAQDIGGRTVVFLDSPLRALHELLGAGVETIAAARMLTSTLAPLPDVLRAGGALLVRRTPDLDLAATRRAIASHLGLPVPPGPLAAESAVDLAAGTPALSGQPLALLRQVLIPLQDFATDAASGPIVWPLACFYNGDQVNELAPPLIELAGPARVLYYGPYFHLPRGRWRVDVQFFFSSEARNAPLAVEVTDSDTLARVSMRPTRGGVFQASFPLAVTQPEKQIEVRVWLMRGAIEGQVGLRQVVFSPVEVTEHRA